MVATLGFLDISKLYSRKLLAERCLLAIARHQAGSPLEVPDTGALARLDKLLSNVSNVQNKVRIEALAADAEGVVQIIEVALEAENRGSTLTQLLVSIQALQQTTRDIREGREAKRANIRKLADFTDILATTLSENITNITQRKAFLATSARHA
ncbi:MAG: hypothetical protein Q7R34_00995 [Dehalococcoidia bacterium]|nr:hypothetical protein [Dehalococcoidia bacterium]